MEKEIIGGTIGTGLSAIGTATQTNEILQTISLVITILGGFITFVLIPIITWYNNAKKDGKITKEEIDEGVNVVKDGIEKITKNKEKGE